MSAGSLSGRRVGARFQQQNRIGRARGQPVGHHAAGRAAADNDVVEAASVVPACGDRHRATSASPRVASGSRQATASPCRPASAPGCNCGATRSRRPAQTHRGLRVGQGPTGDIRAPPLAPCRRTRRIAGANDAAQRTPHSDHPCRQPAAARRADAAVRAARARRGGRSGRDRDAKAAPPCARS